MRSISTAEMRELDRLASQRFGIPSLILMENAGRGITDLAKKILSKKKANVLVVCGKGNNGGDGFVAARHLSNRGHQIQVVLLAAPAELKGDAAVNFKILEKMRIPIASLQSGIPNEAKTISERRLLRLLRSRAMTADLIIDAIFGIGLTRPITGFIQEVIQVLNRLKKKILSVDVPSGINSDTGAIMNIAVNASLTGTLHAPKIGLTRKPGSGYAGKVEVLDISIPRFLFQTSTRARV